ncbi:MAG TPA: TetR/AcrR family transcriptional regulator [Anaerolineales bacterium]|jgi:AcrR family transcriptional regulator|nr:TetR/AcrR family transcriptional regulator [Anaerolineales bacterium]
MQRSDIISAAAQIFRQKGYQAASMQDIAQAVHLQKASLYHHVDSKQEILLTILNQALDLLIEDMQSVLASDLPAEEKLGQAIRVYVSRIAGEADLAAVLLLEYRSLEPGLRQSHVRRRDRYEALWRDLVRQGVEAGRFRDVDEKTTTFALLGIQNWMITWFRQGGGQEAGELAEVFTDLILHGLEPRVRSEGR